MSNRPHTGISRGGDGRFKCWCRICPRRQWRLCSPEERAETWHDSKEGALAQAARHRRSAFHQQTVIGMASNRPSQEEVVIARMFGEAPPEPCADCGFYHSRKLDCIQAARIRDREMLE